MFAVFPWCLENLLQIDFLGGLSCHPTRSSSALLVNRLHMDLRFSGLGGLCCSSGYLLDNLSHSDLLFSGRGGGFWKSSVCFLLLNMNSPNTAATMRMIRTTRETGIDTGSELLTWYISDPLTFSFTVLVCCLPRQKMAVQFRLWTPSPAATMKVMVDLVSQMPRDVNVCETSLLNSGTLHENTGGCDMHVCSTEHETVKVEPASTSAATVVITGFSGEAFMTTNTQLLLNLYLS